jgi:hypothetical protein
LPSEVVAWITHGAEIGVSRLHATRFATQAPAARDIRSPVMQKVVSSIQLSLCLPKFVQHFESKKFPSGGASALLMVSDEDSAMRRPSIGRLIVMALVATVVSLLTIDTTLACRYLMRHRHFDAPVPIAAIVSDGGECGAPACDPMVEEATAASNCCGETPTSCEDGMVVESAGTVIEGTVVEGTVIEGAGEVKEAAPAVTPIEPGTPTPADSGADPAASTVDPAPVTKPAPATEPAPTAPPVVEEKAVEEPAVEEPAVEEPAMEEPAEEPAVEDPLTELPEETEAPAETVPGDSSDDVFGEPTAEEPAVEEPAVEAPADEPAVVEETEDDPLSALEEPAAEEPAIEEPAAEAPAAEEPAAPAEEPAKEEGEDDDADSLDDLFSGKSKSADELKEAGLEDASSTEESAVETKTTAGAVEATEDLFPTETKPVAPAKPAKPAKPAAPEKKESKSEDVEDLFGLLDADSETSNVSTTKPIAPEFRLWNDNTGSFQTTGKLVSITETHVRLLKDTGKYTTVPKERLSAEDLEYVNEMSKHLVEGTTDQFVSR